MTALAPLNPPRQSALYPGADRHTVIAYYDAVAPFILPHLSQTGRLP